MSSHIPNFFKSHRNKQQLQQQAAAQQAQQLAAQQQAQLEQQRLQQQAAQQSGVYSQSAASSTSTERTVKPQSPQQQQQHQQQQPAASGGAGQNLVKPDGNKGITSTSSSRDSDASSTSAPAGPYPQQKPNSVPGSASEGSSVSSSVAALPLQARTLSTILSGGGGSIGTGKMQMSHGMQQGPQHAYGQQGQYPHGLTESGTKAAAAESAAVQMSGIPVVNQPHGYGQQQQYQQQSNYGNNPRGESVDMMDVSGLSLDSPQPMLSGPGYAKPVEQQRGGSADEERAREKLREAQEQAAQAQAALQYASQQARVATINAVATQAAFANVSGGSAVKAGGANAAALRKTAGRYTLSDFAIERTLGTGSFGRVHLVRSKHNGRFYAVKVLGKEKVVRMKQVEHTNSEREMLVRVRHPFLVNLWGTFHDVNNLYMVMDFVAGGELFSLLRKSQRFPNSVAKFYAAEVALALDYLHSLDIIYRDLKPENLLLGADGHVKVTDFGFAKYVPDITWTLCGTPDYLAPEVVQSKGYNKSVDWYALGVLIFEMLAGYPPFFTEDGNPMKLYEKIIAGKVRYPAYFDSLSKELLKNLLTGDLTKRYGNLRGGSADIFSHGWFSEVDWDKLYRREIPAPYVPKIEGDGDASQFDRYQEADVSEYGKSGRGPHDHLFPDF